jgi:hypothetical protein
VQPYPRAGRGGPSGRHRKRRRSSRNTALKEHNRGPQERHSDELLPIFGLTEARASYGQFDRLPPFVFPNLGTRDQVSRSIVLTNELGRVEYDSPRAEMTTHMWDAGEAYCFWVAHLGGGEWRHIIGRFGSGEGQERFYAWMGVGRGFEGPVRAFPVFPGGRIGWAGVDLDTIQGPRESYSVDTSQASLPRSLVVKLKVDPAKLQNLATTGEMESAEEDDQLVRDSASEDSIADPAALSERRRDLLSSFQPWNEFTEDQESPNPMADSTTILQEDQADDAAPMQTETALVPVIEMEVIDLVSDDEAPIKKERSPSTSYPTPLPSTPSSITTPTQTLSPYQLERTILNMSIPPAKRELTFYLSDVPSLETNSFFAFIAKQWNMDTQSIGQLLVYLPWSGRQKIIKPQLDSTWFLLLKAIQVAPCWANGDGCEIEVEIFGKEGVRVPVKGETDEGPGGLR